MLAKILPPVLLVIVAVSQIVVARTADLTPWKGGGFGMFATLDHGAYRGVDIVVDAPDRSESLAGTTVARNRRRTRRGLSGRLVAAASGRSRRRPGTTPAARGVARHTGGLAGGFRSRELAPV